MLSGIYLETHVYAAVTSKECDSWDEDDVQDEDQVEVEVEVEVGVWGGKETMKQLPSPTAWFISM